MPLARLIHDRFVAALAQGLDEVDWASIARITCQQAGSQASRLNEPRLLDRSLPNLRALNGSSSTLSLAVVCAFVEKTQPSDENHFVVSVESRDTCSLLRSWFVILSLHSRGAQVNLREMSLAGMGKIT